MNLGSLARAALPLVWLALSVPCQAREASAMLVDPPEVASRNAAYLSALDAAIAARKASKDAGSALKKGEQSARIASVRATEATLRAARKADESARHAWDMTILSALRATSESRAKAATAVQASEKAFIASGWALENSETAARRAAGPSPQDARNAARGARDALRIASRTHRVAAQAAHEAAEASWRASRQAAGRTGISASP